MAGRVVHCLRETALQPELRGRTALPSVPVAQLCNLITHLKPRFPYLFNGIDDNNTTKS